MSSSKRFLKSLKHAFNGLKSVIKEGNFQIELAMGIAVIIFSIYFKLSNIELAILVLTISLVLVMEIINTIFERVTDILVPRLHPYAKTIKDMMAGAVLVVSLGSVIIGLAIFYPYFIASLNIF